MGTLTVRLNEREERILGQLQSYFEEDKSKILKKAMLEKFEELRDRAVIEEFEKKLKRRKVRFETADKLIQKIKKHALAISEPGLGGLPPASRERSAG